MLDSMPVNVIFKDLGGRILYANQRFCRQSGRRPGELIGKTDFDLFPQEMAEKYRRDDADVLGRGAVMHDVERHMTADGETSYVEVFKAPVRDKKGGNLGVQVLFWDVTERKLADDAYENERSQLKSLASRLPEVILRLDRAEQDTEVSASITSLRELILQTSAALQALTDDDRRQDHDS